MKKKKVDVSEAPDGEVLVGEIVPTGMGGLAYGASPSLLADMARAVELIDHSQADSTIETYKASWRVYTAWCAVDGLDPYASDPLQLASYVGALSRAALPDNLGVVRARAMNTVKVHMSAIAWHRQQRRLPPLGEHLEVKNALKGARRLLGMRVSKKAAPPIALLRKMVDTVPFGRGHARDRAILLFGFMGAFRRSELVALKCGDLRFEPEGVRVTIRKSKTDQESRGRVVDVSNGEHGLDYCPVAAVAALVEGCALDAPVFLSLHRGRVGKSVTPKHVARVVKRAINTVGGSLDPAAFSGHSLRAGFVTAAYAAGRSLLSIQETTGHVKTDTVAGYVREERSWKTNAGKGLL